ncbi:MAG: hypothetical protein DWH91_07020 [Planctomycetota bacterium]|nr:MAG: hypothetical protein DWH91_07020 [Planctomycetota bacterium]
MAADRTTPHPWGIAGVALLGLVCVVLPVNLRERFQGAIRDLLAPGQCVAVAALPESSGDAALPDRETSRQARYWQAQAATLRAECDVLRTVPTWPTAAMPVPLIQPTLRTARVIAWEASGTGEIPSPIVRGGSRDGLSTSDLVLAPGEATIDQGAATGIRADQLLLAGRSVIGRIARTSQLTSTIQRVTDPAFRGQAQIVRLVEGEAVMGPEGVLAGSGTRCQLLRINATEPVSVGDLVFTSLRGVALAPPLYYGLVTRADLPPGAGEWSIEVAPHFTGAAPSEVLVLELLVTPARLSREEMPAIEEPPHVR